MIDKEWKSYVKTVFGEHLDLIYPDQYIDLRRTFYAGAQAVLASIMTQLSPAGASMELDIEMLRGVMKELNTFGKDVRIGKA